MHGGSVEHIAIFLLKRSVFTTLPSYSWPTFLREAKTAPYPTERIYNG